MKPLSKQTVKEKLNRAKDRANNSKVVKSAKKTRFFSPTPKFFKTLRNIAGGIGTAAMLTLALPVSLPAGVAGWLTWITLVGESVAGTAQFAKDDEKKK